MPVPVFNRQTVVQIDERGNIVNVFFREASTLETVRNFFLYSFAGPQPAGANFRTLSLPRNPEIQSIEGWINRSENLTQEQRNAFINNLSSTLDTQGIVYESPEGSVPTQNATPRIGIDGNSKPNKPVIIYYVDP